MKKILQTIVFTLLLSSISYGQNTVGLLSYVPWQSFDGYNLIYPHNQPNVYLLNNCGEIVHVWEDEANFRPANTAFLREDGTLVKTKRDITVTDDAIWAGGGGEVIEVREWDNTLLWSYTLNDSLNRLHHDIALTDEGTILAIAWENKTEDEALQAGRDTSTTAQDKLWPDYIIELDPIADEVIWEWHAWDHLIQDFDASKDNFGVVADHPELIDVNFDTHDGHPDWLHGNSLDYNNELDQIMISIPYFNEIWVIDHTTTSAQAAGHNGGLSGIGGDLMYRWGNPEAYQSGDSTNQKLFFQHDAHWAGEFLEPTHPHYGKIAAFNNRVGVDYSQANIFTSTWDMYSWSYFYDEPSYGPLDFDITIQHPTPTELYSTGLSSVQCLPNGNSLITSGRFGYSFEITPTGTIVWEYKTPLVAGQPATQGDSLVINNNLTFRMKRYPLDYGAFAGVDLTPQGYIELEPDTNFCEDILNSVFDMDEYMLNVYPNPASTVVALEWMAGVQAEIQIVDIFGRVMKQFEGIGGRKYLDISDMKEGIYLVRIGNSQARKLVISR